jgi:hypothetical protein
LENRVEIPETGNPQQGRVLTNFQLTPERIKQALDLVVSNLEAFISQRGNWETKNVMRDRAYRAILEPPREPTSSQQQNDSVGRAYVGFDDKASPILNDNSEAIKARLKESIIPINKDFVSLNSDSVDSRLLDIRQDELNKELEVNDIERKLDTVVHNAVVFGTYYISVPLVNDQDVILTRQVVTENVPILDSNGDPVINEETGQPLLDKRQSLQQIKEVDRKYFGPGYDPIKDVEDVYLDMFIEDIQKQPIVVRKFNVGWDHLMDGVQAGIYFEDAIQKVRDKFNSTANDMTSRSEKVLNLGNTHAFTQSNIADASPREYKMYQAYCDFAVSETDNQGNKTTEVHKMVISVIENEVVQMMPNPYFHQQIPIIKGTYRDIPGEAYGLGALDTVLDMYREYNDTMNQINDSKILSLNPIKIVSARSVTDKRDLDVYPGAEWTEKQPGDIRFAQFDFSVVSNGLQYLELLEMKINKGMGVQRLMQGAGDQSDLDHTATGVTKVIEQADKKFRMIAKRVESVAIKEWAEMAYKVNTQFNPLPVGGTFREINSETTISVDGVDNFFDNLDQTNKLVGFTQQAASIPGFNLLGFMMQIADNMGIELDPKYGQMFNPPPPPVPEEKPMNVSVTMPVDMTKGTMPAMAAAQILAQKGVQLDLDAIGEAGTLITETTDAQVKEESGILPQERKQSVHRIRTTKDGSVSKENTTDVSVA